MAGYRCFNEDGNAGDLIGFLRLFHKNQIKCLTRKRSYFLGMSQALSPCHHEQ